MRDDTSIIQFFCVSQMCHTLEGEQYVTISMKVKQSVEILSLAYDIETQIWHNQFMKENRLKITSVRY